MAEDKVLPMDFLEEPEPKPKCKAPLLPRINTEEIGAILEQEYGKGEQGDKQIDYFYLQIRKRNIDKRWQEKATEILFAEILELDQQWKKVSPGITWPSMFFGEFPKIMPSETEREREDRLNNKVRMPLKKVVEGRLQEFCIKWYKEQGEQFDKEHPPKICIMITRCCKYTGPDYEYMDWASD